MADNVDKAMQEAEIGYITNDSTFRTLIQGVTKATVKFIKADNTVRVMNFTLDFNKIPDKFHPKGGMKKGGAIAVFDIDKAGWRSIPYDRTDWLKIQTEPNKPDMLYYVKHKK